MKTKILFFILMTFLLILPSPKVLADTNKNNTINQQIEAKKLDNRAKILAGYLSKFDSPLKDHAQDFIDAADTYNLDWKMIPAISGVESTFGKQIPGGFNAWGWGVYGSQAIYFNSWRDGIFTVAKGLRENYLNKGYTEPFSINKIYATSPTWGSRVSFFMADLEKFANQFTNSKEATTVDTNTKIAATSGQLASK